MYHFHHELGCCSAYPTLLLGGADSTQLVMSNFGQSYLTFVGQALSTRTDAVAIPTMTSSLLKVVWPYSRSF